MEGVDEPPNQKKNIILMMCLCVALGLVGQFSQHWLVGDDVEYPSHSSLSTTYWENSGEDQNGQMTNEEKYSESADYSCEFFELSSEFGYDDDYWAEYCDNYSSLRDSGELGSVLLWLGTATGAWFLVVAYRSIGGDRRNLSSAFLDPRFCLAAGGSTTLAAVIWRIMSNDAINFFETKVGTGFYITLVGGLLGIGSYLMISRLQDGENEYPVNDMSEDLHDEDADLSDTDAELLRAAEAAVRAKVEAEANPDEPPNQKKNIILMMCLCVALGLVGQFSQHWVVGDNIENPFHSSLSTTYWENSIIDFNGQMTNEVKISESADYSCEFFELYGGESWAVDASEYCDNYSSLRDSGRLGSVLLWLGTATGAWFLVVAYRSIGGDRRNLSSAFLDPRFCLAAGGSTTLAAVIWRIMSNDAINFFETKVGTGFYITLVGGLLGIGSYLMISRLQEGENEYPVNDMSEDLHDEDADLSVTDAELLRAAEAAVKAKVEAEANPDDPLSWLRMAEAMDAANRHEEAERCRKTAMDLMEKDTL